MNARHSYDFDARSSASDNTTPTFEDLRAHRLSRRVLVAGTVAAAGVAAIPFGIGEGAAAAQTAPAQASPSGSAARLGFSASVRTTAPAGKPSESIGFAPIAAAPITADAYVFQLATSWMLSLGGVTCARLVTCAPTRGVPGPTALERYLSGDNRRSTHRRSQDR